MTSRPFSVPRPCVCVDNHIFRMNDRIPAPRLKEGEIPGSTWKKQRRGVRCGRTDPGVRDQWEQMDSGSQWVGLAKYLPLSRPKKWGKRGKKEGNIPWLVGLFLPINGTSSCFEWKSSTKHNCDASWRHSTLFEFNQTKCLVAVNIAVALIMEMLKWFRYDTDSSEFDDISWNTENPL